MTKSKEYDMAVALLQFKAAYQNLATASKALPEDTDLTEGYPFYLLDFVDIAPAVLQWCTLHAYAFMRQLPEQVDNPRCFTCPHYRVGLAPNGLCKEYDTVQCMVHPTMIYSKEAVIPFLLSQGYSIQELSDDELHLLYIRKAEELYEEKQATEKSTAEGNK